MTLAMIEIKGLIFDLDETLLNTLNAYQAAFNAGLSRFGLRPVDKPQIARFLDSGMRLGDMLLTLSPEIFSQEDQRRICQETIRQYYLTNGQSRVKLKSGVRRMLHSLKGRGFKIGIVTGRMSQGENKWLELKRLGVRQFIDSMVTAAEAAPKPAPDGPIRCAGELNLSPGECIFIGDSRVDILAGRRAGMKTIAILGGVAEKDTLAGVEPDYTLPDLDSLLSLLAGKNQPGQAISIQGVVVRGRGESARFTSLPWVRKQFISRLQIDPYPGTFNLEVKDSPNFKQLRKVKDLKGLEIIPEESGYCGAQVFPVLIEGKIRGALIIPQVPGYPERQLEIIASVNIREALSLEDGELVMVEVTV